MENVKRVATAGQGPGPFGTGAANPWVQAERFSQRAEEQRRRIEKKMMKAEQKLHRLRVGMAGTHWRWGGMPGTEATGEAAPAVSDDERMTILKMLQEKKITAEEAERLLSALEGKA